jgi:zinc protease
MLLIEARKTFMKLRSFVILIVAGTLLAAAQTPAKPEATAPAKSATPAAAPGVKAWNQLVYPKIGEIKLPEIKHYTLANGMKLFLVEDHTLPIVDGSAIIRAGARWVPAAKTGLAGIFGSAMRTGGTASKTGDQLDEALESIAAHVETAVGQDSASASFSAQKGDADKVLAIFADVLMHPEFRQDKIDLAKVGARTGISRRNDEPDDIARREFRKVVYGPDSPYAAQAEVWTVDAVTRADLQAFYQRYYHPNNMMLGVRGDFNAEEMKAKIEKAFADWKPAKLDFPPVPQADPNLRPSINLVKKDDVNQTSIRVGQIGGRYDDPDFFSTSVMTTVLCEGGFSSRLTRHVRSEMGLAYEAGCSWAAGYDHEGLFAIAVGTKSETTEKAIAAVMNEVRDIREKEVTDEELKVAKETILNNFVFNFEDVSQVLDRVMTYEYYSYPADFLEKYRTNVEKVTKADVLRVAQKRLQPASLAIVAVGKDTAFDKPLTALEYAGGKITDVDVTILSKKPAPGGAAAGARAAAASPAAIEQAKPVLMRAIQFMGGMEKIKALKDVESKAKAKLNLPQGEIELELHAVSVLPGTVRNDIHTQFGDLGNFFDGTNGWTIPFGGGPTDMTEAQKAEARESNLRQLPSLLGLVGNPVVSYEKKDGDNDVLLFTIGGTQTHLTIDPKGQVVKRSYHGTVQGMGSGEIEETFADYRDVGGVKMSYKTTASMNGQKYMDVEILEHKINTNPDLAKLAAKPK